MCRRRGAHLGHNSRRRRHSSSAAAEFRRHFATVRLFFICSVPRRPVVLQRPRDQIDRARDGYLGESVRLFGCRENLAETPPSRNAVSALSLARGPTAAMRPSWACNCLRSVTCWLWKWLCDKCAAALGPVAWWHFDEGEAMRFLRARRAKWRQHTNRNHTLANINRC